MLLIANKALYSNGNPSHFKKHFFKAAGFDEAFVDAYLLKSKSERFVLVAAEADGDKLKALEASIQGLPTDITKLGETTDHKTLIERFNISDAELKLNDGLVASVYNKIALSN